MNPAFAQFLLMTFSLACKIANSTPINQVVNLHNPIPSSQLNSRSRLICHPTRSNYAAMRSNRRGYLKVEERAIGPAAHELEGAEQDADAHADAVREQEALAQVPRGVRRARLPVVAAPPLSLQLLVPLSLTAAALVPVELLDGFPQPLLRLPQPPGRRLGHRRLLMLMRGRGGWRRGGCWARAQGWFRAGGEVERRRREERHRRRPTARAWAWAGPGLDSGRVPSLLLF